MVNINQKLVDYYKTLLIIVQILMFVLFRDSESRFDLDCHILFFRLNRLSLTKWCHTQQRGVKVGDSAYFRSHECRYDTIVEIYITRSASIAIN